MKKLENKLLSMEIDSNTTIYLYTSPEFLTRDPWSSLVVKLVGRNVLKLVFIDDIHNFVMFGITVRKEFTLLKKTFFYIYLQKKIPGIHLSLVCATT